MLENSFCHLDGVGSLTETRLWEQGICTWEMALAATGDVRGYARRRLQRELPGSIHALQERDASYFAKRFAASDMWRIWNYFRDDACFLDLETTGLPPGPVKITVAALCDWKQVQLFIRGYNLKALPRALVKYKVVVTFNGKTFDFPVLRKEFPTWQCEAGHIDLIYPLRRVGRSGGLKHILRQLRLTKPGPLDQVGGGFAPVLWSEYKKKGNNGALETLKAYAINDVIYLPALADYVHNAMARRLPFKVSKIPSVPALANPYKVNGKVIRQLRSENWWFE